MTLSVGFQVLGFAAKDAPMTTHHHARLVPDPSKLIKFGAAATVNCGGAITARKASDLFARYAMRRSNGQRAAWYAKAPSMSSELRFGGSVDLV